jgi:group I intron endonuclease
MGYIYKIINTVNNKIYIGETMQNDIQRRWRTHRNLSKINKGCPILCQAFNKYGLDKFTFEIIIICFDEDRLIYEKQYIQKFNSIAPNGYNISPGGCEKGFTGLHHSVESKNKISSAVRNRKFSIAKKEEIKQKLLETIKINNSMEQRSQSDHWKNLIITGKIGQQMRNKKITDETKQKISDGVKKYNKHSTKTVFFKPRKIKQLDENNNLITIFDSIKKASEETKVNYSSIKSVLAKRNKRAGLFKWEYVEEEST